MFATTLSAQHPRASAGAGRSILGRYARRCATAGLGVGLVLSGLAGSTPAASAKPAATSAVLHWNAVAGQAAIAACIAPTANPLTESRMYAMTHIAIHDAVNAIRPRFAPHTADLFAPPRASVDSAVAAAARTVLVSVLSDVPEPFGAPCGLRGLATVDRAYTDALARIPAGVTKAEGVAIGEKAARSVIEKRTNDGSQAPLINPDYPQGIEPGEWRFTEGNEFAFGTSWDGVKPFGLTSATQIQSAPPHPLTSAAYAKDYNEIKRLGGDGVTTRTTRTAAQTETALFWVESSPLAWNRMARAIAVRGQLDTWEQARLFGLLNIALADGYISSFAQKYDQLFWRPITAIRSGDTDGNRRTTADPRWMPLLTTPPVPDHDSAHAVEGGAATGVFRKVFGTDRFSFSLCSLTVAEGTCNDVNPVWHRFHRFSQAAAENSVSRVYVGFHFRWATVQGQRHGEAIGRYVADELMGRVHPPVRTWGGRVVPRRLRRRDASTGGQGSRG